MVYSWEYLNYKSATNDGFFQPCLAKGNVYWGETTIKCTVEMMGYHGK